MSDEEEDEPGSKHTAELAKRPKLATREEIIEAATAEFAKRNPELKKKVDEGLKRFKAQQGCRCSLDTYGRAARLHVGDVFTLNILIITRHDAELPMQMEKKECLVVQEMEDLMYTMKAAIELDKEMFSDQKYHTNEPWSLKQGDRYVFRRFRDRNEGWCFGPAYGHRAYNKAYFIDLSDEETEKILGWAETTRKNELEKFKSVHGERELNTTEMYKLFQTVSRAVLRELDTSTIEEEGGFVPRVANRIVGFMPNQNVA